MSHRLNHNAKVGTPNFLECVVDACCAKNGLKIPRNIPEIRESEAVESFFEFIFFAHRSYISLSNLGTHKAEEKNQIQPSHHPSLMELL